MKKGNVRRRKEGRKVDGRKDGRKTSRNEIKED